MANLGILEGSAQLPRQYGRTSPHGTLASSRYRRSVGPSLLGADTVPEDILSKAKAATNAAVNAAKTAGVSPMGIAAAGKNAYDKVIADWRASLPTGTVTPPPFETAPSAGTKTQDELRNYYNVPAPEPTESKSPVVIKDNITQEDLRAPAPGANATVTASVSPSGKSLIVPIAAIAAAYFFLKG